MCHHNSDGTLALGQPTNIVINTKMNQSKVVDETMLSESIFSQAGLNKLKALHDLESNMEQLEEIIVSKDQTIDGLKR